MLNSAWASNTSQVEGVVRYAASRYFRPIGRWQRWLEGCVPGGAATGVAGLAHPARGGRAAPTDFLHSADDKRTR